MNNSKILKYCFTFGLFALQFEEFQIYEGISVFLAFVLPSSLLGLLCIKKRGDSICRRCQDTITILLLLLASFNLINGDYQGIVNKLLLIVFCRFFLYCFCNASIRDVRYDYIFLITTILNILALVFGFGTFKEEGLRFCGIYKDPNFLCVTVLFAMYSKMVFFEKVSRLHKIVYLCLFIIDAFLIFSSGSRGGLLVVAILLSVYLLFKIESKKLKLVIVVLSTIGIVSIWQYAQTLTLWGGYYDNPVDQVLSRFNAEELSDGSHRTALWENSFKYMHDHGNILFPVGYENLKEHLAKTDTVGFSHNSYIDFASDAGYIVAAIVIISLLLVVIFILKSYIKKYAVETSVLFMTLASFSNIMLYMFLSAYAQKLFWVSFLMLLGVYHHFKTNNKIKIIAIKNETLNYHTCL